MKRLKVVDSTIMHVICKSQHNFCRAMILLLKDIRKIKIGLISITFFVKVSIKIKFIREIYLLGRFIERFCCKQSRSTKKYNEVTQLK